MNFESKSDCCPFNEENAASWCKTPAIAFSRAAVETSAFAH